MPWTASIRSLPTFPDRRVGLHFETDDGSKRVYDNDYAPEGQTGDWLERKAAAVIAQLESDDAALAGLSKGQSVTPSKPVEKTPDEQARQDFSILQMKCSAAELAIKAGLLKADDPDTVALFEARAAAFRPEFIGL